MKSRTQNLLGPMKKDATRRLYSNGLKALGIAAILGIAILSIAIFLSKTSSSPYWTKESNIVSKSFVELTKSGSTTILENRDPSAVLSILEIKENGNLVSEGQLENILNKISELSSDPKSSPTILIYAHGWHNDASPSQGRKKDLGKFDTLVYRTREITEGPVLGIYVGWRGELIRFPGANQLTLDGRRNVARMVGSSPEVKNAFEQILQRARSEASGSKVIFIGHSLGACLMQRMAHQMMTAEKTAIDEAKLPDLFFLVNNAETAPESSKIISDINSHPGVLKQLQGDTLICPWVISVTSEGDWANEKANPLNGILLHWRFGDTTPGFAPGLLTHRTEQNKEAKWPISAGDKILELVRKNYLEPAFFAPSGNPAEPPIQYQVIPNGPRSVAVGYWNLRIPEATVSDHNDIYNVNSIGVALSMLQMANRRSPVDIKGAFPEGFLEMNSNSQRDALMKMQLPVRLQAILDLEKLATERRGENDTNTVQRDIYTNLGRQLTHGPQLRIPFNDNTISIILTQIADLKATGPFNPESGKDYRRRYATRLFNILKYSHNEPNAWSKKNINAFQKLVNDREIKQCFENMNPGWDEAKIKFQALVQSWPTTADL